MTSKTNESLTWSTADELSLDEYINERHEAFLRILTLAKENQEIDEINYRRLMMFEPSAQTHDEAYAMLHNMFGELITALKNTCEARGTHVDIVNQAIEHHHGGRYGEAFELISQLERTQQESFYRAVGIVSQEDRIQARIMVGAYKLDREKDPVKRQAMMRAYDALTHQLEQMISGRGISA